MPTTRRDWLERAGLFLLALSAPFVLGLYLRSLFGKLPAGTRNVSWPPGEWISQEQTNWHAFMAEPFHLSWWEVTVWEWRVFELIVPVCLLVQAVHLVLWRDYRSPLWWLGISFAALFLCLGQAVTAEEIASARTMLPLTLVFNMRLAGQRGGVFWGFFLAGNFGMFWCFQDMLAWCARQT